MAWLILAAGLLATGGASAQPTGALIDFKPAGFVFKLDGQEVENAGIFQSRGAGAFLILSRQLSAPVLIRLREAKVETVDLMKVDQQADGSINLLPGYTLASQGGFQVTPDGSGVTFSVDGKPAVMMEKPPLLGDQTAASIGAYSPDFRRRADDYTPSEPMLRKLRGESRDVKVEIYFGSWCPHCQEAVPKIMKVDEQLAGSRIHIAYYGLPPGITGDPKAGVMGIKAVPTGVVYIDGREIGRILGNSWGVPELALNDLLSSNQSG